MARILEKPKTGRRLRLLPIALLLAATVVLIAVSGHLLPREAAVIPDDTVEIHDGVRTVRIRPWEDVPASGLTAEAFSAEGDLVIFDGAEQGIDVSEHQGQIDWEAVAGSGISFVFIRLGYRGTTEGEIHIDPRFEENLTGAQTAGLKTGVYFFSQALDEREAIEEADFVTDTLNGRRLELPVMFDWEPVDRENSRTEGAEKRVVTVCAEAFCRRAAASGYAAGVYFNRQQGYYSYDLSRLKDLAFWVSEPGERPTFYYAFRFWQYSFTGSVPGIGTVVDRNLMFEAGKGE